MSSSLLAALDLMRTLSHDGNVACELTLFRWIFTVSESYLCVTCHYMFATEFLATKNSLNSTVKGLEIACSDFVQKRSFVEGEDIQLQEKSKFKEQM